MCQECETTVLEKVLYLCTIHIGAVIIFCQISYYILIYLCAQQLYEIWKVCNCLKELQRLNMSACVVCAKECVVCVFVYFVKEHESLSTQMHELKCFTQHEIHFTSHYFFLCKLVNLLLLFISCQRYCPRYCVHILWVWIRVYMFECVHFAGTTCCPFILFHKVSMRHPKFTSFCSQFAL